VIADSREFERAGGQAQYTEPVGPASELLTIKKLKKACDVDVE